MADAGVGFLLSGGLDSSLVCAIAAKNHQSPFAPLPSVWGPDAIDLKYAREVADYIGNDHTEVIITRQDVMDALGRWWPCWAPMTSPPSGPASVCTWCARLSTRTPTSGCCLPERSPTSCSVISIRTSPPPPQEFQKEAEKRIRELHMYDVLRADRCISVQLSGGPGALRGPGLCPLCHGHRPEKKRNHYGKGKYLLRRAFEGTTCPLTSSTGRRQPSPMQWATPW